MAEVVVEEDPDYIDVFEIKEEKNQFLLNVYGLVSTGLMFTMFAIFASYGHEKATQSQQDTANKCVPWHLDECSYQLYIWIVCLCLLKILCWEVCFPTPPSKYLLKYFPVVFFAAVVISGSITMAYIAQALTSYETLFNILVMASLTIIVGYAIPVTAKKLHSRDWATILRYTNVFFSTFGTICIIAILFLPIMRRATGPDKKFFVFSFVIYLVITILQVIEYGVIYLLSKKKKKIKDSFCTDAIMVYGSFIYLYAFLVISHPFYNIRWW